MKLIVGVNNKGYIGKNGELMWKCKEDLAHFKQLTSSSEIIVGRTTYEKCLGGKNLPGRVLRVVGTGYLTLPMAVRRAMIASIQRLRPIWVIGGSEIYKQLLPICDEVHISHIDDDQEGDTTFELPSDYRGQVFNYYFKPDSHGTDTTKTEINQGNAANGS